jgi:hypothetical protein
VFECITMHGMNDVKSARGVAVLNDGRIFGHETVYKKDTQNASRRVSELHRSLIKVYRSER